MNRYMGRSRIESPLLSEVQHKQPKTACSAVQLERCDELVVSSMCSGVTRWNGWAAQHNVRTVCLIIRTRPTALGTRLVVKIERSFILLEGSGVLANLRRTSSIRGCIAGSSWVIRSIKSFMNPKSRYF